MGNESLFLAPEDKTGENELLATACQNEPSSTTETSEASKTPMTMTKTEETVRAEIIWAMKVLQDKDSRRSADEDGDYLRALFPDSDTAKSFTLKKDRLAYLIAYGIAPCFKEEFTDLLRKSESIVILFDETMNTIGFFLFCFNFYVSFINGYKIETQYFTSVFMTKTRRLDLLKSFEDAIPEYLQQKILKILMDGPNVNGGFLKMIEENLKPKRLLQLGSCGLHAVHGAYQFGFDNKAASLWKLFEFLRATLLTSRLSRVMWRIHISNWMHHFPLKFCSNRWCENITVAKRALEMLPHLDEWIKAVANKTQCSCQRH